MLFFERKHDNSERDGKIPSESTQFDINFIIKLNLLSLRG